MAPRASRSELIHKDYEHGWHEEGQVRQQVERFGDVAQQKQPDEEEVEQEVEEVVLNQSAASFLALLRA